MEIFFTFLVFFFLFFLFILPIRNGNFASGGNPSGGTSTFYPTYKEWKS